MNVLLTFSSVSVRKPGSVAADENVYFIFSQFHVSFSLNGPAHLSQENKPSIVSDVVDFFLSSVGATFTEMKDVELK